MKTILTISFLCLFFSGLLLGQNESSNSKHRLSFSFKVNASGNLFYGLKRENYNNIKILNTPPGVGPELQFSLGLSLNEYGTLYGGIGASMIPIHWGYGFISIQPIEYIYEARDYFMILPIISVPVSFEYAFPIKNKHHFLTEAGIMANYTINYDYSLYSEHSLPNYPPYFQAEIHNNNELKWFPSGFVKLGYQKRFKKQGAFSTGLRFVFSGAILGRGKYRFNGFESGDLLQGEIKLPVNAMCIDFTYHFRHSKKKK